MAHNLWGEYDDLKKKYIRIFETVTERDFRKKSKAREHIQNDATLCSGFFFGKCARLRYRVQDFSRIYG